MVEMLEARQLMTGTLTSTVAITSATTYIPVGGSETFTATITPAAPGGPVPTGTVEFYSYNSLYPTQYSAVQSDGTASLLVQGTTPGYIAFYALYSGDDSYASSDSPAGTAVVNAQSVQPSLIKDTLPASVVQGGALRGSATVSLSNPTGTKIIGTQTIVLTAQRFLGSSFATTTVGSLTRNVVLAAGASKSFVVPVNIKPADGIAGDYSLVPTTTNKLGQSSFEIAYAASVHPAFTVSAASIDLSASLTTVSPASGHALPGKSVSVALEIFNNGNVIANGSATTTFSASNNPDGSSAIFVGTLLEHLHIAPGKHQIVHITRKIPIGSIPGTYHLVANVDTLNTFNESDLTNNIALSPTTLTVLDPYPNIVGGYSGTWIVKRGPDKGAVNRQVGFFTAEDETTGTFTFSATNYFQNGTTDTPSGVGTITPTGVLHNDLNSNPGVNVTTGHLLRGVIHGTFILANGDSGTFLWTLGG